MNKIFLIGRLTKDPELRYTSSGKAVASFTLAVDRRFSGSGEKEADFINIVVWNKAAENCAQYVGKGRQVAVEGRLQIRTYEGNDGQKRWVTEVIADYVEFLSSGNDQGTKTTDKSENPMAGFGQEIEFNEDDVPF